MGCCTFEFVSVFAMQPKKVTDVFVLELHSQIVRSWADSMLAAAELTAAVMSPVLPVAKPAPVGGRSGGDERSGLSAGRDATAGPIPEAAGGSRSATGRSWYRAPYRSPFDPLFWLEPSAAVAVERPIVGDVVPGFYQPWAAGAAWTWNPMAAVPWMQADWLAGREGALGIGGFNRDCMTSAAELATSALFSAYRSAGGHAVGQIARPGVARPGTDVRGGAFQAGGPVPLQGWGDLASIQRDMALNWMRLCGGWR